MQNRALVPLLLAATAIIAPASAANWFSNPYLGINRNIGSAPSPTPEQVRQNRLPPFVLKEQDRAPQAVGQTSAPANQVVAAHSHETREESKPPGASTPSP